jgi:hypothetical protein
MKKFAWFLLFSAAGVARGQLYSPAIRTGTSLNYTFYLHGQQVSFDLGIKQLTDTLVFSWNIRGLAGGTYIITPAALNKADKMSFTQPVAGAGILLADNETFCMISKMAFSNLVKDHRFAYDNTVYLYKDDTALSPVILEGRPLDLLHVVAQDETTELWVLNNPAFPLICKIRGNVLGIDCLLKAVKQRD